MTTRVFLTCAAAAMLAACAGTGAAVYAGGLGTLWALSGRAAAAPERMLAGFLAAKLAVRTRRRQPAPAE